MFPKHVSIQVDSSVSLKSVDQDYAEALYILIAGNKDQLQRYLPKVVEIDSIEAAHAHVQYVQKLTEQGELLEFYILFDQQLCGVLRLNNVEQENHKLSIAYFLDKSFQGKGIVTRAARTILTYCFSDLNINRVELRCVTSNLTSIAVAERLRFTREGELRQAELLGKGYVNHYVYGLLSEEHRT